MKVPDDYAYLMERGLAQTYAWQSKSFGDWAIELSGEGIRLRISSERGGPIHAIARGERTQWIKLEVLLALLTEKSDLVREMPEPKQLAALLRDNWYEALGLLQDQCVMDQANADERTRMMRRLQDRAGPLN